MLLTARHGLAPGMSFPHAAIIVNPSKLKCRGCTCPLFRSRKVIFYAYFSLTFRRQTCRHPVSAAKRSTFKNCFHWPLGCGSQAPVVQQPKEHSLWMFFADLATSRNTIIGIHCKHITLHSWYLLTTKMWKYKRPLCSSQKAIFHNSLFAELQHSWCSLTCYCSFDYLISMLNNGGPTSMGAWWLPAGVVVMNV